MSTSRQVIGVDFSSAPTNRKPITVAVGQLIHTRQPVYRLETIRELPTLKAFEQLLAEIDHFSNHDLLGTLGEE